MRVSRWLCAAGGATILCAVGVYACGSDDASVFAPGSDGGADGTLTGDGGPPPDFGDGGLGDGGGQDSGPIVCGGGDSDCPNGLVCVRDRCLPPQGPCSKDEDCKYDTYCAIPDAGGPGECVPFGSQPDDRTSSNQCQQLVAAGVFAPKIKCEFKPPNGDPFPFHVDVQATPMVVNFNQLGDGGVNGPPSVVVPFDPPTNDPDAGSPFYTGGSYSETEGIVRVMKGTDCTLEANLGGPLPDGGVDLSGQTNNVGYTRSSSPVAVGDLDGDKVADVVVYMADKSTVAFTRKSGAWKPLWPHVKATLADGVTTYLAPFASQWAGPSIHDLDDDGKPEVIREGAVIDGSTGKLVAREPTGYTSYSVGVPPVLANIDADPRVELITGQHVWEWDPAGKAWVADTGWENNASGANAHKGWAAVADFNPYDNLHTPEIVVASDESKTAGALSVYNADRSVFMGMYLLNVPGFGGGPPTVADYDGDGLPEIGLAGEDFYTVFDPDCSATPRPGGHCDDRTHCDCVATSSCGAPSGDAGAGTCPDYILWSRKTQDHSSNITGSSVFDFEADGKAEVVYADECFTRVYSGLDGRVLFSQYRSSCTWLENPVVADTDGNFRADLVVPSNIACGTPGVGQVCGGLDANGVDDQFVGLICEKNTDCASGTCDAGYCRCTASAQCCGGATSDAQCEEFGFKCAPPPAGTAGAGNTCRADHPHGVHGIRIYQDGADRWVRSRTIWNQHAYAVTHVNEDGTIPRTSQWLTNWTQPGLDNFRQNVPGTRDARALGDFTSGASLNNVCDGQGHAVLSSLVCNRGGAPVGAGIPVGFYDGATKVCSATTAAPLDPGQCEAVSCTWANPPSGPTSITVVPNDGAQSAECDPSNNQGLIQNVFCIKPK